MDHLLSDRGCAWDRAQTLDSLRPYLLEEAYEVLEAMDDPVEHREELGDLLFQIVFQSALREREGAFDLDDVIRGIRDKLVRRHPHVFAADPEGAPLSPAEVERQWEAIKREEKTSREGAEPFAGVPRGLPALARSRRLQEKASALGFDWPDVEGAIDKLREEIAELDQARREGSREALREELGDLLFVVVRVGQKLGLDPEDALRRANEKFEARFAHVLRRCREHRVDPAQAGLDRLEGWWQEAKRLDADRD